MKHGMANLCTQETEFSVYNPPLKKTLSSRNFDIKLLQLKNYEYKEETKKQITYAGSKVILHVCTSF